MEKAPSPPHPDCNPPSPNTNKVKSFLAGHIIAGICPPSYVSSEQMSWFNCQGIIILYF